MNHDVNNYRKYEIDVYRNMGGYSWSASNSMILPGFRLDPHMVEAAEALVNKSSE